MNVYQKTGTFIFRLVGAIIVFTGFLGILYYVLAKIFSWPLTQAVTDQIAGNFVWIFVGACMIAAAKLLGRWVGKSLD
jgi:hypothetical protein